ESGKKITGREKKRWRKEREDWRLAELEGGCRAIKTAMGKQRDEALEQRYYRFQLIARRAQRATPFTEKLFSYLYAWTSKYGASIGRPFVSVLMLVAAMTLVYWGLDIGYLPAAERVVGSKLGGALDGDLARAVSFSASRVFPFGAFEDV